jgi:hypothetical protein
MAYTQRQELLGNGLCDIEMSNAPKYYNAANSDQDNWQHIDSDEEDALRQPPPGEEGEYHSHAGKEVIFHEIYEKCKLGLVGTSLFGPTSANQPKSGRFA